MDDRDFHQTPRRQLFCPTCGRAFASEQTPVMPFCSIRCQQIDLGRWFNEEIGLPVEAADDDEQGEVDRSLLN
jgi:hypothetical protein